MRKGISIIIFTATFGGLCCNDGQNDSDKNKDSAILRYPHASYYAGHNTRSLPEKAEEVSDTIQQDTIAVGTLFFHLYHLNDSFYVMNLSSCKLACYGELMGWFEEKDFNQDGNPDIIFEYISNSPFQNVLLFDPQLQGFVEIKAITWFPSAEKIAGTEYYYSYHRSGCADANWDSDLFYIEGDSAIQLGNIAGHGCEVNEHRGIYISKVRDEQSTLIDSLPISAIGRAWENKWDLIHDYWTNNYKKFTGK